MGTLRYYVPRGCLLARRRRAAYLRGPKHYPGPFENHGRGSLPGTPFREGQPLEWAATIPAARNQTLNLVNGNVFHWNWLWSRIAGWFGLLPALFPGQGTPLEQQLAGSAPA